MENSLLVKCKKFMNSLLMNQRLIRESMSAVDCHNCVINNTKIELIVNENDRIINEIRNDVNKYLMSCDKTNANNSNTITKSVVIHKNEVTTNENNDKQLNQTNNLVIQQISSVNGDNKPEIIVENKRKKRRIYCCDWPNCGYETVILSNVSKHYRVHSGEKPCACDWPECDKRYQQQSGLAAHKRIHLGLKPFACDYDGCQYRTNNRCSLPAHRRTHTGIKRFACDWPNCGISCATITHLRSHKLTHTGERPFKCDVCEQSFTKCGNMRAHKLSVHQGIKRVRNKKD